jgi:2',3'-cyclic-nucleotide 2'-phosphodiesterase (5'-nucleotidase family)
MKHLLVLFGLSLVLCCPVAARPGDTPEPAADDLVVTLLFTNDMESAYEPFPAFWIEGLERIGGIAHLSSLIKSIRAREPNVFLFDSGDIFTGVLSRLTEGALMFEFMLSMDYDAMGIGNHEFDYGHEVLLWEKNRVPFPVLGANLFWKGQGIPFAQPHAIIERNGIRIGVIGTLGQDAAATAVAPRHIAALDVTDPAAAVQRSMEALRGEVDLVVLLTHQGHTAPMQTDAEVDPRLARDIDDDIALAGAVDGIDVLFGGHADAGTWEAVVQPETGTLIMQTFGQATYLGYLQLTLDAATREIKGHDGRLLRVDSDALAPDPVITEKYARYLSRHPQLAEVVGHNQARLNRKYFDEASIGNFLADVLRESTGADIGLMHPGGIRKDLPAGEVKVMDVLDTNPFIDPVHLVEISGATLKKVMEQSFTQLRGLMQVSGLEVIYDTTRPEYQRLVSLKREGREVQDDDLLRVGVSGIIARGGDHYEAFLEGRIIETFEPLGELTIAHYRKHGTIPVPGAGRQKNLDYGETH